MRIIHVICGPTASGKSALAVDLAREQGGVVINADSMQIYDALPTLTAQPSAEEKDLISHALYAVLPASSKCSAQRWRDMAIGEITKALAEGRAPVVVGGTGLYLKALMSGLAQMPDIPADIRQMAVTRQKELGSEFHQDLAARDPVMAARLNPNDTQRMIRAWEVMEATGRSLAEWQTEPVLGPPPDWTFKVMIKTPEREILHYQCDKRFDHMLEASALQEVEALAGEIAAGQVPEDAPITNALGFRVLRDYLQGLLTRKEAITRAKAETRQYAKRQDTWFRHQIVPASHIEVIARVL